MKKAFLFAAFLFSALLSNADSWDSAKSKNAGNYVETYSITVTTSTATLIVDPAIAIKSAAIDIYPNSAYALFVGTNTTTLTTTGFPISSSTTYTTDGTFTGPLYGTAIAAAAGNTNVRVIYWLKNDAIR